MKFKVGDRVKVVKSNMSHFNGADLGAVGTIVEVKSDGYDYTVDFGEKRGFTHDCHGVCPNSTGRWYDHEYLERVDHQKIVIATNGTETFAKLFEGKKLIKTATAKCSPHDKFDFMTGAKIAYDRLTDGDKVKVGDYIKVLTEDGHSVPKDSIVKVVRLTSAAWAWVKWNDGEQLIRNDQYEIVHDYVPPYNGKIVCTNVRRGYAYTVGKIYEVKDGQLTCDNGSRVPVVPAKTLDDLKRDILCDFIEVVE